MRTKAYFHITNPVDWNFKDFIKLLLAERGFSISNTPLETWESRFYWTLKRLGNLKAEEIDKQEELLDPDNIKVIFGVIIIL